MSSAGIIMPSGFLDQTLQAVKNRVVPKFQNPSSDLNNFLWAEKGIYYRCRSCADYSSEFTASLLKYGDGPPLEERYQQDRQLFGFFVSGFSAMDCFRFFVYFAASRIQPAQFPVGTAQDIRKITAKKTLNDFLAVFPTERLTMTLQTVDKDPLNKEWTDFRNILAHRADPGREIALSTGSVTALEPTKWGIDSSGSTAIDVNLTTTRLSWLLTTLSDLINAVDDFTLNHF